MNETFNPMGKIEDHIKRKTEEQETNAMRDDEMTSSLVGKAHDAVVNTIAPHLTHISTQLHANIMRQMDVDDRHNQMLSRIAETVKPQIVVGPMGRGGEKGEKGEMGRDGNMISGEEIIKRIEGKMPYSSLKDTKDDNYIMSLAKRALITDLRSMTDVDITGITTGQTLVYNTLTGKWTPATAGGGGTVTSVTSSDGNIAILTGTTTPSLTLLQAPALKSATTTVNVSASAAPTLGQVLTATGGTAATWQTPAVGGTVTSVSVVSANGLTGTVTTPTTTPTITLTTSVTGVLKGNGTAISAATAGTDYQAPISLGAVGAVPNANGASFAANVLNLQPANLTNPGVVTTGAQTFGGLKTFEATLTMDNQQAIQFVDSTLAATAAFKAPFTYGTGTVNYLLPVNAPTAGQVMSASAPVVGVVTLSWISAVLTSVINTFTVSQIFNQGIQRLLTTQTTGGAVTVNFSTSADQVINVNANITGFTFTAPTLTAGNVVRLTLRLNQTGAFTIAGFPGTVKFPGATAPVLTATAGKADVITFDYNGVDYLAVSSQNF